MFDGTPGETSGGRGRPNRRALLGPAAAITAMAAALTVFGPTGGTADAAAACAGRPVKAVGLRGGELHLFKGNGYACAVTVADSAGARRQMSVTIQARGGAPAGDSGVYTQRAGPITVYSGTRCVRATGAISGSSAQTGWVC
ncbi:hypothetical protein [Streptomyces sp. NBC_00083]|uniref:hypothetical protein n=1 Tax=Streptomyces sp. NBC_00083 TaxID=2975647 RepID=UPI002252C226|nr:hypothetical protein [Streptomyces sp. NBC_00083]MCX5382316.1 hypothetical protein [Streptomyces sp. NBC_00083]